MDKPESTPSHKMSEHTTGRLTNKARMFEHLCEKERCMGKPESTPSHKTNTTHKTLHYNMLRDKLNKKLGRLTKPKVVFAIEL